MAECLFIVWSASGQLKPGSCRGLSPVTADRFLTVLQLLLPHMLQEPQTAGSWARMLLNFISRMLQKVLRLGSTAAATNWVSGCEPPAVPH